MRPPSAVQREEQRPLGAAAAGAAMTAEGAQLGAEAEGTCGSDGPEPAAPEPASTGSSADSSSSGSGQGQQAGSSSSSSSGTSGPAVPEGQAPGASGRISTRLDLLIPAGSHPFLQANVLKKGRDINQLFEQLLADGKAVLLLQQIASQNAKSHLVQQQLNQQQQKQPRQP